jgi:hypothetical protein
LIGARLDQRVDDDIERIGLPLERLVGWSDIFRSPDFDRNRFNAKRAGRGLDLEPLRGGGSIVGFNHDREPTHLTG